jgi:hypothetical protein
MMYGTPGGIVEMFGGRVAYSVLAMGEAFSYRGEAEAAGKNCAGVPTGDAPVCGAPCA